MQVSDFTPALWLLGMVTFIICSVRAGRIRDPRDSDGRKLPRTGDEEGRARRIARGGQLTLAACILVAFVIGIITRPDSLLFVGLPTAACILLGLSVYGFQRRRRLRADE